MGGIHTLMQTGKTAWIPHATSGLKPQQDSESDRLLKVKHPDKKVAESSQPVDVESDNTRSKSNGALSTLRRAFSDCFCFYNESQDSRRFSGSEEPCGAMPIVVMAACLVLFLIVCAIIYFRMRQGDQKPKSAPLANSVPKLRLAYA